MRYMLDTNICIYLIKRKPASVIENLKTHMQDGISISTITLAELEHGVAASAHPEKNSLALKQLLTIINVSAFDDEAAACYGTIRADLQQKGTPIGPLDTLIAAHAKAKNLTLVTNNIREFERIKGLSLANWA